jgi:hypothetical protein
VFETCIAIASTPGSFRIDLVQEFEDSASGSMQTVKVKTIETDFPLTFPEAIVVVPEPLYKLHDVRVSPHATWKSLERRERLYCRRIVTSVLHVAVNAVGIWPVRLHCNRPEAFLFNQPFCDLRSGVVKVVGSVRGFS